MHYAAEAGQVEALRRLLSRGADINAKTDDGFTPLLCALIGENLPAIRCLLDNKALTKIETNDGRSAVYCAASCRNREVLRCLLEHIAPD